jgi:hypothetical protein
LRTIHASQNLAITYETEARRYLVAVTFAGDTIHGEAPGLCPRCGGPTQVTLWELEGPGGESNTFWLTCAAEEPCLLDGRPLRWSVQVKFEGDWEDL